MRPKIGLLPLYIQLYDEVAVYMRPKIESFLESIISLFEKYNIDVVPSPICKVLSEFETAISTFEEKEVDALVTMHLAYSPSLEVIPPLLRTSLPIVVLDTTMDEYFGPLQTTDAIMYNHGIHGVQDMCSMLVRNNKKFFIEAGHWLSSDVIKRIVSRVKGISAATLMSQSRIGIIGEPFKGMGDFQVEPSVLKKYVGLEVIPFESQGGGYSETASKEDVEYISSVGEIDSNVSSETLKENIRILKNIKKWISEENLDGFTFNFMNITKNEYIDRAPFLAAAILMYEGIGYAGEGDVLTAALVSSLLKVNDDVTFTEMFCPDWHGDTIFLSHMGEINPRITFPETLFTEKEYTFSDAYSPVYATGTCRAGEAHLVNCVPLADNKFRLIVSPVTTLNYSKDNFDLTVRGWIRPKTTIVEFLERYSRLGGTHHCALSYGENSVFYESFADTLGWDFHVIQ